MNDSGIINALTTVIEDQLNGQSFTDFEVSRSFQPSDQYAGADDSDPIKTRIFLHVITNPSMGHSRKYSADNTQRADLQHLAKTIQVSVLHAFTFSDVDALTPEDVCALIRRLLDSPDAIKALRDRNIFLQDVGELRPIFFVNDKDLNESAPNFDLTVTYRSEIIKNTETVDSVDGGLYNEGCNIKSSVRISKVSWGAVLTSAGAVFPGSVIIDTVNIDDGETATLIIDSTKYSATILDDSATFIIPALNLKSLISKQTYSIDCTVNDAIATGSFVALFGADENILCSTLGQVGDYIITDANFVYDYDENYRFPLIDLDGGSYSKEDYPIVFYILGSEALENIESYKVIGDPVVIASNETTEKIDFPSIGDYVLSGWDYVLGCSGENKYSLTDDFTLTSPSSILNYKLVGDL